MTRSALLALPAAFLVCVAAAVSGAPARETQEAAPPR